MLGHVIYLFLNDESLFILFLSEMASKCLHTSLQEHMVETQIRYQLIYRLK